MLTPGDHTRTLTVDGRERSYLVHIPERYDGKTPTPVVIALHGAVMNGSMMAAFSGLNTKADQAGFIVVYPDGTGPWASCSPGMRVVWIPRGGLTT